MPGPAGFILPGLAFLLTRSLWPTLLEVGGNNSDLSFDELNPDSTMFEVRFSVKPSRSLDPNSEIDFGLIHANGF
jgi:hypothetical protein